MRWLLIFHCFFMYCVVFQAGNLRQKPYNNKFQSCSALHNAFIKFVHPKRERESWGHRRVDHFSPFRLITMWFSIWLQLKRIAQWLLGLMRFWGRNGMELKASNLRSIFYQKSGGRKLIMPYYYLLFYFILLIFTFIFIIISFFSSSFASSSFLHHHHHILFF